MYDVQFRPDLNLLDIAWSAQFAADDVASYAHALKARFVAEGFRSGYRLRMDMSDSAVQPQIALPAIKAHLGDFPKASRIAVVTPSTIAQMQVRRIMTQPYLRIFADAQPALNWLLENTVLKATGRLCDQTTPLSAGPSMFA